MRWVAVGCCVCLTLFAATAWADGVKVYEATDEQRAAASEKFGEANDLFDDGKHEESLAVFRASHDIVASPNSTLMAAHALMELGRVTEAYSTLLVALKEAEDAVGHEERYSKTWTSIRQELTAAEVELGRVKVQVVDAPEGTVVRVGDMEIPADWLAGALAFQPGELAISATAPDGRTTQRLVTVQAGHEERVELTLPAAEAEPPPAAVAEEPAPAPRVAVDSSTGPSRTLAYVAGGVGALGLAGFGVLGSMSQGRFDDLEKVCQNGACPAARQADIDDGSTYQTFANVSLVVGVLGIGAGVTLFVLSTPDDSEQASIAAKVTVGARGVQVKGTF